MTKRSALQHTITRWFMKLAVALYRGSGGRIGGTRKSAPVLLLTTTGRKSGAPRTKPVIYQRDDQRFVVIASGAGSDRHPSWWLNLRSTPEATIELGKYKIAVTAREADDAEQDRLWALMVAAYPGYNDYTARTSRKMAVIVLEPTQPDPGGEAKKPDSQTPPGPPPRRSSGDPGHGS